MRAPASRSKPKSFQPARGWVRFGPVSARTAFRELVEAFARHNLLTYASAIAFQVLIAAVALALLMLALLDLLALEEVWSSTVQPVLDSRLLPEASRAVGRTVQKIFASGSLALLVFASLLALWEVSGAVRAIMGALNEIYETDETRSLLRRFGTSFALSTALIVCVGGAVFTVTLLPRLDEIPNGLALGSGWIAAVALLGAAVWLLLRYAPSATQSAGWTSLGSVFVIVAWIGVSLLFVFYVRSVASYTSAIGSLAAFLTLTAYLYTSSIIFLTGAQIDELLRRRAQRGAPASTR